jgi:cardiolipin synthase
MNVPNLLTIVRILLVPVFIYTLLNDMPHRYSLAILLVGVVTDWLDGFIARNFKQRTALGKFLDPLADKILILSSYFVFALKGIAPVWFFLIILGKDVIVVTGWLLIYVLSGSRRINVRFLGKMAVFLQMIILLLILLRFPALAAAFYISTAVTLAAAVEYIIAGFKSFSHQESK